MADNKRKEIHTLIPCFCSQLNIPIEPDVFAFHPRIRPPPQPLPGSSDDPLTSLLTMLISLTECSCPFYASLLRPGLILDFAASRSSLVLSRCNTIGRCPIGKTKTYGEPCGWGNVMPFEKGKAMRREYKGGGSSLFVAVIFIIRLQFENIICCRAHCVQS